MGNVQKQGIRFHADCSFNCSGTGKGGTSIWGRKFEDEYSEHLKVSIYRIEKVLLLFAITHVVANPFATPLLYFSITSEEWFLWQTMAPTPMAPSFSSHTPNSPTWIWSTQCLESMSSLSVVLSSVIVALVSLSSTPRRVIDGLETLDELEKQPVNEKTFRPLTETRIKDVTIHANPFAG